MLDALVHALPGPFTEHSQGQIGEEQRAAGQCRLVVEARHEGADTVGVAAVAGREDPGGALGGIDHSAQLLLTIRLDAHGVISPWVAVREARNRLPTSAQFATFHQAAT